MEYKRIGRHDEGNFSVRVLSMPESITQIVAQTAVQLAKSYGNMRGWRGTEQLMPIWGRGWAGVHSPHKYLFYQNFGTKPRVMWELEGKTIPIRDASGVHFVLAKEVGQPGWVRIPGRGMVWREQKWKHPGIKPTRFMDNAMQRAIRLHKTELQKNFVRGVVNNLNEMKRKR